MSDLTPATWREIEKSSVYLPQDGRTTTGRYVGLGTLKNILRKSRRSGEQNRLLWSLYGDVLALGGESLGGFTKDDLHEFFLVDYFGADTKELFGRKKLKPRHRSSRLTKMEFGEFVDHIVRFMAEKGVVLTLPGDMPGHDFAGHAMETEA